MDYPTNTAGHRTGKKSKSSPRHPPAQPPVYNPYAPPPPQQQQQQQSNPQLFDDTSMQDPYGASNPMQNAQYSFPMEGFPAQQFLQNPQLASMAVDYGQNLVGQGRQIVDQKLEKYVSISTLKYYFAVDTNYVLKKLGLILFPFTHSDWSVHYNPNEPIAPRYEVNAPDLYIPTMAFVTYILVTGYVYGTQNRFTPELLGIQASSAMVWLLMEILAVLLTIYITRIDSHLKLWDLVAFCSYKYVGVILSLLASLMFSTLGYFVVLIYSNISLGFFLVRTLRVKLLSEKESDVYGHGSKRRIYLLLFIAILQPVLTYFFTYHVVNAPVVVDPVR